MPIPLPPVPSQAFALLDALRGFRYALRSGRRKLNEIHKRKAESPEKLAAGVFLRHFNGISEDLDHLLSKAGEQLHPVGDDRWKSLESIVSAPSHISSDYLYRSLKLATHRLGYKDVYISEASCVEALASVHRSEMHVSGSFAVAAKLARQLVKEQPMLRLTGEGQVDSEDAERLAIHAVVLALCAEGNNQSLEGMLFSATDIVLALSKEVLAAYRGNDMSRVERLLEDYATHV